MWMKNKVIGDDKSVERLEIKGRKGVREVNKNVARKQFLKREGEKILLSIQYYSSRWVPAIFSLVLKSEFHQLLLVRQYLISRQILEIRKFTLIFQGD
jgi:hypothetical protein